MACRPSPCATSGATEQTLWPARSATAWQERSPSEAKSAPKRLGGVRVDEQEAGLSTRQQEMPCGAYRSEVDLVYAFMKRRWSTSSRQGALSRQQRSCILLSFDGRL